MNGVIADPERQQQDAADEHAPRTVAVGDRPRDRLHRAPDELAYGHGQADGGDAEPGGGIERRQKQALGLSRPHGDHQQRGGKQDDEPVGPGFVAGRHG